MEEVDFTTNDYHVNMTQLNNTNLIEYDKSFNILIGTALKEEDFDWYDNPYISPNLYYVN